MPDSLPERMWLRVTGEGQWTIADHQVNGSEQEAEYVRADLCAELEVYPPRSGHWTGVEMQQLRYLLAAMTGRTLEEVTEPASELCHRLRYRVFEDVPGMVVTSLEECEWEVEDGG